MPIKMMNNKIHSLLCYWNGLCVTMYLIVVMFILDLPSKDIPYSVQAPILISLCFLPNYIVKNTDKVLNYGDHDFDKSKLSRDVQRKILLFIAYGFTALMSMFSIAILISTFNNFNYFSPLF